MLPMLLPMFDIKNNATGHPFVFDNDWCGMAERKEEAGVRVGKKQASRQRIDTEAPNKATKTIKRSRYAKIQKPEIRQLNSHYGQRASM